MWVEPSTGFRECVRLKHMAIAPADIKAVVIKEDDFGHEMRVGQVLRSIPNMEVKHGGTYTDSVTGKPRQYDYRVWFRKDRAALSLAVECKNLNPIAPLIICGAKRQKEEAYHELIESRQGTFRRHSATVAGLSSITLRASGEASFYPPGTFCGKSLLRLKPDNKGNLSSVPDPDIYDKWSQALASGVDLVNFACEISKTLREEHFYTAILPIVVVPDNSLWKAEYDETGTMIADPEPTTGIEFFVGRKIQVGHVQLPQWFKFWHIHFLTLMGFQTFLAKITIDATEWGKLLTESATEI
jgi:hypothetical protein